MPFYISNTLVFLILFSAAVKSDESGPKEAQYSVYLGGRPAVLQNYQEAVLREILSQGTVVELQVERQEVTSIRAEMLAANQAFDLSFSTNPEEEVEGLIRIPVPAHNGVLGLRNLIIHQDQRQYFNLDISLEKFRSFSVGQGSGWSEVKIYKHAGITVLGSHQFSRLFELLNLKRIDYLPLGVIESHKALESQKDKYPDLIIAPNIYILYAMPTYIVVSAKNKELAQKIEQGVAAIQNNSRLQQLFEKYFSQHLNSIDADKATLIVINNPLLDSKTNKIYFDLVTSQYFNASTRMLYLDF